MPHFEASRAQQSRGLASNSEQGAEPPSDSIYLSIRTFKIYTSSNGSVDEIKHRMTARYKLSR